MSNIHRVAALVLACTTLSVRAQTTPPELQAVPEPPPIPPKVESGEVLEPDVRIVRRGQTTVTEYRLNGRLHAIRVQPDGEFPPYYLVDTDGDGRLDQRRSHFDKNLLVPAWVIFSW